ncbi:DUF3558 domain-containing protein [Prauserella oleivorans]
MLSGCSDSEGGTPTPVGQPSTQASSSAAAPSSSAAPGSDTPSVAEPLDVSSLEQDPCAALSSQQVQQLNLQPGKRESTNSGAPVCEYEYKEDSGSQVSVILTPEFTNGIGDVYARKDALAYFEPTEIAGYPAAYASNSDGRSEGTCQLHVGLTDQFVVSTMVQLSSLNADYPRGCEVAELSTQTMIENLKGGAR